MREWKAVKRSLIPLIIFQTMNNVFVVQTGQEATPENMFAYEDFDALVSRLAVHFGVKRVKQGMAQAVRDESDAHLG